MVIKIGLIMYDAYSHQQKSEGKQEGVPPHQFLLRQQSLQLFPQLNRDLRWPATYYDGAIHQPERLCIELIRDPEAANHQVRAINYVRVVGALGIIITLRDEISGRTLPIKPEFVLNTAGPWIDFATQSLDQETQFIGGTKGSQLILDHPDLRSAIGEHEFFIENDDGRIVLIYPLFEKILVGTLDSTR